MASESHPDPCRIANDWLSHQGYAVEFATATVLDSAGWNYSMAINLAGGDRKLRDCDLLATRCFPDEKSGKLLKCVGYLLIECKHVADDRAWALLGKHPIHEPRGLPSYIPHRVTSAVALNATRLQGRVSREKPTTGYVAHGLVETRHDVKVSTDHAYAAVSKVIDLAWAFAGRSKELGQEGWGTTGVFVVPCVVLRGALVEATYSQETRRLVTTQIQRGAMVSSDLPQSTRVDLVTLDGLPGYLADIDSAMRRWAESVFRPAARRGRSAAAVPERYRRSLHPSRRGDAP